MDWPHVKDFIPLMVLFSLIICITLIHQIYRGWDAHLFMTDFMGFFFVIFALFKIINLNNFVQAYSMYDIIAQRSTVYAYVYPFIELFLGALFLSQRHLFLANSLTLVLMLVGALGVWLELRKGHTVVCACLGAVFKIPMTYVTLAEDLLMGAMALIMLIAHR